MSVLSLSHRLLNQLKVLLLHVNAWQLGLDGYTHLGKHDDSEDDNIIDVLWEAPCDDSARPWAMGLGARAGRLWAGRAAGRGLASWPAGRRGRAGGLAGGRVGRAGRPGGLAGRLAVRRAAGQAGRAGGPAGRPSDLSGPWVKALVPGLKLRRS
jgi:hypothetical protein